MVDMLARAGRLDEAEEFIGNMGCAFECLQSLQICRHGSANLGTAPEHIPQPQDGLS